MELTLQKGVEKFRKLRYLFCYTYFSADNTNNMTVRCSDQGDDIGNMIVSIMSWW